MIEEVFNSAFGPYLLIVAVIFFFLWLLTPVFIFTIRGQVVEINKELRGTQEQLRLAVKELTLLRQITEDARGDEIPSLGIARG